MQRRPTLFACIKKITSALILISLISIFRNSAKPTQGKKSFVRLVKVRYLFIIVSLIFIFFFLSFLDLYYPIQRTDKFTSHRHFHHHFV